MQTYVGTDRRTELIRWLRAVWWWTKTKMICWTKITLVRTGAKCGSRWTISARLSVRLFVRLSVTFVYILSRWLAKEPKSTGPLIVFLSEYNSPKITETRRFCSCANFALATSAKKVMFSLCLIICLFAGLCKTYSQPISTKFGEKAAHEVEPRKKRLD